MTGQDLLARLRVLLQNPLPLPGSGQTAERHLRLMKVGRENLSLARLAEAHWDALAILAEAGREAVTGAIYGVWASEIPGSALTLAMVGDRYQISGGKKFCSGAGLVDRALITTGSASPQLIDLDLQEHAAAITFDDSAWKTNAFAQTKTAVATFNKIVVTEAEFVGTPGWYLERPGFWHGACAPAACWAGGAAGLVDYAVRQVRNDPHTLAHLGAMQAQLWALQAYLEQAGHQVDADLNDVTAARIRARTVRHLVEQACTDVLRRLARAYGPHPLAMDEDISRRYQELDIYVRQSHAERDLEALGREFTH